MHGVAPFPLYWPLQHPRATRRRDAKFKVDFSSSRWALLHELDLLGARDVLISSNVPIRRDGLPSVPDREPEDPGVAVYFTRGGRSFVIACDQFTRIRWNLRAIGNTVEALRSIERNGSTSMLEQAFSGFAALPFASAAPRPWHEVLGVAPHAPTEAVRATYRELVRKYHPDVGGDRERMLELNAAMASVLAERGLAS